MPRRRSRSSIWSTYVPVAQRRRNAARLQTEFAQQGQELQPVRIEGRGHMIARTFWGSAWCTNLERYSDFSNRLPRGRTYVRNGSVIDLKVAPGTVTALVSGSEIYEVEVTVKKLSTAHWRQLRADCAGGIDSLVELLQGRFSSGVMDVLCRPGTGMFPEPGQLSLDCSCPDWAVMCKHTAAVLYGVGARLDEEPQLLFTMRQVDHNGLISARDGAVAAATAGNVAGELAGEDLGSIFGIELAEAEPRSTRKPRKKEAPGQRPKRKKAAAKKKTAKKASSRQANKRKPTLDSWITAAELRERGVPNHTVQAWLHKGLIEHSGERGIYVRNRGAEALIEDYLQRKRSGRGKPRSR